MLHTTKSNNVTHLILLHTKRQVYDLGYYITVVSQASARSRVSAHVPHFTVVNNLAALFVVMCIAPTTRSDGIPISVEIVQMVCLAISSRSWIWPEA